MELMQTDLPEIRRPADEQVRQARDIAHNRLPADVLAECKRDLQSLS